MNKKPLPVGAALVAAFLLFPVPASAYDEHAVSRPDGTDALRIRFYGVGDGDYVRSMGEPTSATWNLNDQQKRHILGAAQYWAEVITPEPGGLPVVVNVGTFDNANAFGTSTMLIDDDSGLIYTGMQVGFQGWPLSDEALDHGSHGQFAMGRLGYADEEFVPSQLGMMARIDASGVAVHELAHGLGVMNLAGDVDGEATPHFGTALDVWADHLVDDNGNPARPGQAILCTGCNNPYDPAAFDARQDRSLFIGEHVMDALEGGLPGVPVRMLAEHPDGSFSVDDNYMSHIELQNSLMSHQDYRNYARFMEAELAILQDLGYTIDRRNFFGRSIYGSGLDIVNDRGFHARDAAGTTYLPGQYNTATTGLGLHVYGSHNRIRQVADLLSGGAGGTGIRVDGEGNALTVDPGVRVHATGLNGQGIIFAYGKGHTLVHRGEVRATGERGVGLRFDFGHNLLGDATEYRGSYIRTDFIGKLPLLPALQGALVDVADITGTIEGREAAIYMSPNALVNRVNIMAGARIDGDIVSEYRERDDRGALRLATVSFGQKADAAGRSTGAGDGDFAMRYTGSLRGTNLQVSLNGGVTALEGNNAVHGVTVQQGAALAGNGDFTISDEGVFRNDGTIAPGDSLAASPGIGRIAIAGDFVQGEMGRLLADFRPSQSYDLVSVSGTARLDGTLELRPEAGWYASEWQLDANIVDATRFEGEFAQVKLDAASPTLAFGTKAASPGRFTLTATRPEDAYARHAADGNGRRAGIALGQLASAAGAASPDAAAARDFVAAIDFSAPDGSDVRRALSQVSPGAYNAGVSASLHREREVMDVVLRGLTTPFGTGAAGGGGAASANGQWQGFAMAFGGRAQQDAHGSAIGHDVSTVGLVLGTTRRAGSAAAWRYGAHMNIAHQSIGFDSPLSGKGRTTAFGLGLHTAYAADEREGLHLYGGVRVGIEHASMERNINAAGYRASHKADWTGHSASAAVGGGYRWRLGEGVSAGPVAALQYAWVSRPAVEESGNAATRLRLDKGRFDALRSSLGVAAEAAWSLENGAAFTALAQATWDREWLDRAAVQHARFAAFPAIPLQSRNEVVPRNSLGLKASLNYQPNARVSVGAAVTGQLGGGYREVRGELRVRWAF